MSIFDIFKKDEEYKGFKLSSEVDTLLQKNLIDRGRGNEINSLTPGAVTKANKSMNVTADSTPAIVSVGKNTLAPEPVTIKQVSSTIKNKAADYLGAVEKTSKGEIKNDAGGVVLTQDLPGLQQAAGSLFSVGKNIVQKVKPIVSAGKENIQTRNKFYELISQGNMKDAQNLYKGKDDPLQTAFNDAVFNNPTGKKILKFTSDKTKLTNYIPGAEEAMKKNQILSFVGNSADAITQNLIGVGLALIPYAGKVLSPAYYSAISAEEQVETKGKVTSLTNIAIDTIGDRILGETIEGFLKQGKAGAKSAWKQFHRTGLIEGGTEVLQTITKNLNDYQTANTDEERKGVIENMKEYFKSGQVLAEFGIGYIAGGTVGGIINTVAGGRKSSVDDNIITVPESAYRLKEGEEEKYFQTEEAAKKYIEDNGVGDNYSLTQLTPEEIKSVVNTTEASSFPFVDGKTTKQQDIENTIDDIVSKGLTRKQAVDYVASFLPAGEVTPTIYSQAVQEAKAQLETGQPAIIQEAIDIAKGNNEFVKEPEEILPEKIYHQTFSDIEQIKEKGYKFGKNSVFGEAAFFGEKENKLYGENQITLKPSDFKLKIFRTVSDQQSFIQQMNAKNLADAVRAEGKYDGFIIPNPEGNVFAITNNEKLNQKLKEQQFVTTEEARAISKQFKFIEELNLPVNAVNKIMTPAGKDAFGRYYNGVISFIENPHKTTLPHEAVHAFVDLMLTDKQKKTVLDEVKRRYSGKNFNDIQAEEQLAEDFAKYYTAKFDNPATAKAPSNKIKQFFDWLINQFNKLIGKGDIIANLYRDIETKKPGIIKREMIRQKIARRQNDIAALQKEYFQDPDALTTKFLENVDVKHREFSSYEFLKNLLKSKSLPLKENERNLIDDILDNQFKGEKKIDMVNFRDAVRGELLPLQVIESETYADYGSSEVELGGIEHTTHIYNSPFNHGYTGHFGGDFTVKMTRDNIEIKQIPGKKQWAIIRKGVNLTEENIAENVYHVANSEKKAEEWIQDRIQSDYYGNRMSQYVIGQEMVDVGTRGLFGHTRIWDQTESDYYKAPADREQIRYVAEIQSDSFQNFYRIQRSGAYSRNELDAVEVDIKRTEEKLREAELDKDIIDISNKKVFLKSLLSKKEEIEKSLLPPTKAETGFLQYKNIWHERLIREEIRRAAMDNVSKLRFPTPYTISKIEGYLSADGQIPEETEVGDTFDYGGENYMLLKKNEFMDEYTGQVIPESNVRGVFDYEQVRQEDIDNEISNLSSEVKDAYLGTDRTEDEKLDNINDYADGYFTKDQLKKLTKYIKEEEDAEIEDMLTPIAEARVDDRYSDAYSYADYYNDEVGDDFTFATDDEKVIILEHNTGIETFGIGGNEAKKENFNYEEDLDADEHKTVARFYDKQVGRYLSKLRKQNLRTITDENGYDWLETDILPEDKGAVEAFQTKPAEDTSKRSGKEVVKYFQEIEKEKADLNEEEYEEDDYLENIIEGQNYSLTSIKINDLLSSDATLKEYVDNGENRYGEDEGTDPDLPIIVGYWKPETQQDYGVLDGFNRVLTKLKNGEQYIEAFVSDKYQDKPIFRQDSGAIEEFVAETDLVARERFIIPNLKKLSFGGSDRDVYDLGYYVLKVAKTARGLQQNQYSHDYYAEQQGLIPKTIEVGSNYIVKEKVLPPDKNVKEMVNELKNLSLINSRYFSNNYYDDVNKAVEILEKYGYNGSSLMDYGEILWGDVKAIRNWGVKDGDPILLDEGTLNGSLIKDYTGVKNMSDPEFRDYYYRSREAKKKFGDLDAKTKYQEMTPSQISDLQYRRQQALEKNQIGEFNKESEILNAREANLVYANPEQENGYKNFKKLATRRKWILDTATDEEMLKRRLPAINIDNYLFSGATDINNNDLLEEFKDRYYQEELFRQVSKQKTPSEIATAKKKVAETVVKKANVGRKATIKNAINVAQGIEKPLIISMKEKTLLNKKIRDIARGVKMGRSDMRNTMIEAFRSKLENIAVIKKAIVNYASDLPSNERGRLLPMVANAKNQLDLTKAMMRIDAALQNVDKKEQLQEVKKSASIVKKAIKSGRGIAVDYQKKLVDILDNYDLTKPTARTMERLQSLKNYVEEHPGFVPDYVVEKLGRLSKRNPGQMTVEEVKELNETLNHLIALGQLKLQLKNKYDERAKEINLAKLIASTNSIDPRGNIKDVGYSAKEAKKNMYISTLHSFRVTDMIDGYVDYKGQNTRLQRAISHKVNNAELTANSALSSALDEIKAIKKRWSEEEQSIMMFHLLEQQGADTQANELATAKGWTEIPKITSEMETAIDIMRGVFTKTEDYLASVYEEIENKPFEKVENYFPIKYEQKKGDIPEPTIGQKYMRRSKTEQGFTMKRVHNVKRIPRTDVFSIFEEAIREQQYYMQVQPALVEIRELVNDEAYKEKAGRVATNWWKDFIDAMSNRGQLSGIRSNAWLRQKRVNLSRAILGFKLSSIVMQPMAIFDAYSYVQMRFGQLAANRMLLHFTGTWLNPLYARHVLKKSPSLQLRKGTAGELAFEEIAGASKKKKLVGGIERLSMKPLQYFDVKTAASVDQAVYRILKGKGLSDSDARAEADLVMNIVSGSSEIADRPMVLMKDEIYRTIFTFQTFMLNRWGLIAHDIIGSGLIHGSLGKKIKALYALFILALAGGIENELRGKIYEKISGKPLENKASFWQSGFMSIPEAIPVIGNIIEGFTRYSSGSSVPLVRIMENMRTGLQQAKSDDPAKKKKGMIKIGEAIGTWYGIPGSAQFADILEREPQETTDVSSQLDVELPALPDMELPELPELPALPAL